MLKITCLRIFEYIVYLGKNPFEKLYLFAIQQLQIPYRKVFFETCRSSRPKVFCKKGVLWNFGKLTGKHLSLFNKVAVHPFKKMLGSLSYYQKCKKAGCLYYSTLVPRSLSLALDPRPLGPRPPKYCKNKFMNKAYYLFKIILIQD